MARNGSFNTGNYDGRYLKFEWSIASQSIENNRTTINWSLKGAGGTSNMWYMTGNVKVVINGSTVYESATRFQLKDGTLVANGQATIDHNSDGTKKFSASAQAGIYTVAVNCSGSGTWDIDPIARATVPKFDESNVITGEAVKINLPRASTNFTHTLKYEFLNAKGTIATKVGTSYSWTVPRGLASQIPNSTKGTVKIIVDTYNGSTHIGTKSDYIVITLNENDKPTISSILISEAVSGIASKFGKFIQGHSKIKLNISSDGIYGSEISKIETRIRDQTYTGSEFITDFIQKNGTIDAVVTVTDSRARTTTLTRQFDVLEYVSPTVSRFSVERALWDGTSDPDGTYLKASIKYAITSLNNLNDSSYKLEYKEKQATSWTTLKTGYDYTYDGTFISPSAILNVDYSYDIRIVLTDYFLSVPILEEVESSFSLIDYNANGNGLAFGKSSERENAIETALPIYDPSDTIITNGLAQYTGGDSYAIDPNTTLDNLICTNKNTPKGEWFFISTFFYRTKVLSEDRSQIAIPYYSLQSMYHRVYTNGAWSEWRRHMNGDETLVPGQHDHEYNTTIGYYKANNGWFGFYGSFADAKANQNRKAWLGHDNGQMFQIMNEYSYSTRLNFKNGTGVAVQGDANALNFQPLSMNVNLGSAGLKWKQIYAQSTSISTSDREAKKDFMEFDKKYEDLFFKLKPQLFKFKNGESDRLHSGFISQDVEDALYEVGLNDKSFAGFCKDQRVKIEKLKNGDEIENKVFNENGDPVYDYALRYSEFIALNTYMLQKAFEKIEAQQREIEVLKDMIKKGG